MAVVASGLDSSGLFWLRRRRKCEAVSHMAKFQNLSEYFLDSFDSKKFEASKEQGDATMSMLLAFNRSKRPI